MGPSLFMHLSQRKNLSYGKDWHTQLQIRLSPAPPTGSFFALNHPPDWGPEQRGRLLWLADFYGFLFIRIHLCLISILAWPLLHAPQTRETAALFSATG